MRLIRPLHLDRLSVFKNIMLKDPAEQKRQQQQQQPPRSKTTQEMLDIDAVMYIVFTGL